MFDTPLVTSRWFLVKVKKAGTRRFEVMMIPQITTASLAFNQVDVCDAQFAGLCLLSAERDVRPHLPAFSVCWHASHRGWNLLRS
jgi:hypothetical protein